jgi:hypothetical protein
VAGAEGTFEAIAQALARLVQPLVDRVAGGDLITLLAELGLQFPEAVANDPGLSAAAGAAVVQIEQIPDLASALATAVEGGDTGQILSSGLVLAKEILGVVQAIAGLGSALKTAGAGAGIPPAELNQFADELALRLLDDLAVIQLEAVHLAPALDFIGFVERTSVPSADAAHPAFVRRRLHFDQLLDLISNPAGHLRAPYGWGDPGFDGHALLQKLYELLTSAGVPAILDTTGPQPVLDALFFEVRPKTDVAPPGLEIDLVGKLAIDNAQPFKADNWQITLVNEIDLALGTKLILQPNDTVSLVPPSGQAQGRIVLEWTGGTADGPSYTIIGTSGSSGLTAQQLVASAGLGLVWNTTTNQAQSELSLGAQVKGGKLTIDLSDADGFIGTILGGVNVASDFTASLLFSTAHGLTFQGSSALQIQLPLHVSLGPVDLTALTITAGFSGASVPIGVGVDFKASLGPLQATVQQLGFTATITVPGDYKGNIGPADIEFGFLPPTGVGLSIDAAVVSGGGFLSIDTARGQYAGVLQLTIADFLNVTAIGLIETKLPDGSEGFSLLIILTADFGAGIQLGFGFTLSAVGGLVGLNRGMLFQPIMDAIRTNAITSVLFPQDVIANATRIISDLQAFFPPVQGTFLIGPMAKIGWGEPTLASLSLGVIIEIPPGDIAILGIIRLALPADDVAILVLQVNFAGAIEVDKQRIYFYAALFDSHVLFITIDGSMGLLVAYGTDANFIVSVGGFHPQFHPPPLPFPTPQRISLNLINESFARIHADGYFAVTSNTVQFGTHANYFFGFSALNVQGASSFDALIQFSPFHFIVSFSTSFSVNIFGIGAFGIDIALSVEGPTPFHASGTASISFFFFSVGINIDFTWGESRDTTLPPIAVMPLLTAELGKQSNWRALLPSGNTLLVSLRHLDAAEAALVLHPVGMLQISQRLVPLDLTLDKFGNQKPSDANLFALNVTSPGLTKTRNLQEEFAPSQFQNLSDAQKLSQPGYVPLDSGIELAVGGVALASGTAITRNVRYDLTIIDTKLRRVFIRFFIFTGTLFRFLLNGSSVTRSPFSAYQQAQRQPFEGTVTVSPETFAVAFTATNKIYRPEAAAFTSQAAANNYVARTVANDPTLGGTLHVLPQFELAA